MLMNIKGGVSTFFFVMMRYFFPIEIENQPGNYYVRVPSPQPSVARSPYQVVRRAVSAIDYTLS